ncbi:hypothetical protein FACS189444_3030 [Spirochaetia bacterium]|nr:hypothetical protein FACS189444_3030 [Spirochaetia bacterium]
MSVAAAAHAVFNLVMIPVFKQNGAIMGTWRLLHDTVLFSWNTVKYFVAGFGMFAVILFAQNKISNSIEITAFCVGFGSLIYAALLLILREKTCLRLFKQ